jgi:UDP-N-acetylglucosamine diphosphorylase/glucosamine-1-phosphate N-acetyltransferase
MEEQASPVELCIFEDARYLNFLPLVLNRPVFDLFIGTQTLGKRIIDEIDPQTVILACRNYLAASVKTQFAREGSARTLLMGELAGGETIFFNGRLLTYGAELKEILSKLQSGTVMHKKGVAVAAKLSGNEASAFLERLSEPLSDEAVQKDMQSLKRRGAAAASAAKPKGGETQKNDGIARWAEERGIGTVETGVKLLSFYWQLIEENSQCIRDDFEKNPLRGSAPDSALFKGVDVINEEDIVIGAEVEVRSGTVLDASEGPIVIADGVGIEPNAIINGPCYIGERSIIRGGAKLGSGTSIGKDCRIGGEVEESVILHYTNKQHEGFLGHSYIGSWVNIGAGSCNSDLKNNYGHVKAWCAGSIKETGRLFLGVIVADHAKIAINTRMNAGTVIGFSSNILSSGFPSKFIPSFTWAIEPEPVEFDLEKALLTAQRMMDRRNIEFTTVSDELFRMIYRFCKQSGRSI